MANADPIEPWVYMDHLRLIKRAISQNDMATVKQSAEKCRSLEERVDRQGRGFQIPQQLRDEFITLMEKVS